MVSWNTPRTHNHLLEALVRASAACCLWLDQAHARALKHTFLSLKHTCLPAEYTANDQGAVPGIQAGRQTNPSTQRAVTGIQAGRQPGPNKGRQRETNESVRQMKEEEPVRRESRDNPRCQEHHWVSRRRFVEHHQRIDRRFNSSVIHVCFTGGLTEPSRS